MSYRQTQSPYQTSPTKFGQSTRSRFEDQSPTKQEFNSNEAFQQKLQNLESQLTNAQSDLEIANFKAKKASEMEEKVDMVLKHNAQLLGENDQLSKGFNQKKTESEVWKQKYESQMNNSIQMKATNELDLKKLNGEISRIKDLLDQNQMEKVRGIEETASKSEIDKRNSIQSIKLSYNNDLQIHQEQIKKLRDIIEQREQEINVLNFKIEQFKKESSLDQHKLNDDKEKMKMKVSQMEVEHHNSKEFTKQSTDKQYTTSIENLKKHYEHEMDVLDGEIQKLKGLLDLKSQEIQNLIAHNQELKINFDEESHMLRIEIQNLKDIIHDNNEQKENEIHLLRDRLADHHTNDLQGLQFHNDNQIEALQQEVESLKNIINDKQYEIEKQIAEKQKQRDNYHVEVERLNKEIELQLFKVHVAERQRDKDVHNSKLELENTQKIASDFQNKQDLHIKELEKELAVLKSLLEAKTTDLDETTVNYKKIRANLEDDIKNLKSDYHQLELRHDELDHQSQIQLKDIEMRFRVSENDHVKKSEKNEHTIQSQMQEIDRLQDTIQTKQKECNNLLELIGQKEQENKSLQAKIDNLQENIHQLEAKKSKEKEQLKSRMDQQHNLVVDNLQSSHNNQVDTLNVIITDHQVKQEYKHKELISYAEKFSRVENVVKDFVSNPDKLRDKAEVSSIMNLYTSLRSKQRSPTKSSISPQKYEQ